MNDRQKKKRDRERRRAELSAKVTDRERQRLLYEEAVTLKRLLNDIGVDLAEIKEPEAKQALRAVPLIDDLLVYMTLSEQKSFVDIKNLACLDNAVPLTATSVSFLKDGNYTVPDRWQQAMFTYYDATLVGISVKRVSINEAYELLPRATVNNILAIGHAIHQVIRVEFNKENGDYSSTTHYFRDNPEAGIGVGRGRYIPRFGLRDDFGQNCIQGGEIKHKLIPIGLRQDVWHDMPVARRFNAILDTSWTVRFAYEDGPGICLPVNATAVKSMFAHRAVPEGYSRRRALLHWVCQHWRSMKACPEDEAYVREHMRGTTDFDWFGFKCRLSAPLDVERNQELKEERAAMSRDETRRPRA